jgi:hypothetical protein
MSQRTTTRSNSGQAIRFTVQNPDTQLSQEAIDAWARLLLSLSRQSEPVKQESVAA